MTVQDFFHDTDEVGCGYADKHIVAHFLYVQGFINWIIRLIDRVVVDMMDQYYIQEFVNT